MADNFDQEEQGGQFEVDNDLVFDPEALDQLQPVNLEAMFAAAADEGLENVGSPVLSYFSAGGGAGGGDQKQATAEIKEIPTNRNALRLTMPELLKDDAKLREAVRDIRHALACYERTFPQMHTMRYKIRAVKAYWDILSEKDEERAFHLGATHGIPGYYDVVDLTADIDDIIFGDGSEQLTYVQALGRLLAYSEQVISEARATPLHVYGEAPKYFGDQDPCAVEREDERIFHTLSVDQQAYWEDIPAGIRAVWRNLTADQQALALEQAYKRAILPRQLRDVWDLLTPEQQELAQEQALAEDRATRAEEGFPDFSGQVPATTTTAADEASIDTPTPSLL